jgi:hypothetical protein
VAFENILQFQALGTATLEGADSIGLGIKHGMTRTLGVPFCGFDFQHDQTILFGYASVRKFRLNQAFGKAAQVQCSAQPSSSVFSWGQSEGWTAHVLSYLRSASFRDQ